MSFKIRSLLTSVFALVVFAGAVSAASAATIRTGTASYTARTTALQTLSTSTPLGAITIACNQTIVFNVTGGTYTVGTLTPNANVSAATFACNSTPLGTPTVTPLFNPNWGGVQVVSATASTVLFRLLNVRILVNISGVQCLFSGTVDFSVNNNSTVGRLLSANLSVTSGPCIGATVGSAPYSFSPAFSYVFA